MKITKRVCLSLMALAGIASSCAADETPVKANDYSARAAEEAMTRQKIAVYGGPRNLVSVNLYGIVLSVKRDGEKSEISPVKKIPVSLFMNGTYLIETAYTDGDGKFYFKKLKTRLGGDGGTYTIEVGSTYPGDEYFAKKEVTLKKDEVSKEVVFSIPAEKITEK